MDHLPWRLGACADEIGRVGGVLDVEILHFGDAEGDGGMGLRSIALLAAKRDCLDAEVCGNILGD